MVANKYAEWAQASAGGVQAAAPYTDARRRAQSAKAQANRGRGPKCGIKGCTRSGYKGRLCRAHYAMIPIRDRIECMGACMDASAKTADRYHAKFLRELRQRLAKDPV